MEFFSLGAFILGVLIFLSISLTILFYSWFCLIWKIKIVEVVILTDSWFAINKNRINGITYILGWLPFGSHIKPLGMLEEDIIDIPNDEQSKTFFRLSKYKQSLFRFSPKLVWIFVILVCFYSLDKTHNNPLKLIVVTESYIFEVIKSMLLHNPSRTDILATTNQFLIGKSKVIFSLIILMNIQLITYPINPLMLWMTSENQKTYIKKIGSGAIMILIIYVLLWLIPSYVFSFFSWTNIFRYILSVILGVYTVGFISYLLVLFFVKFNTTK